MTQFSPLHRLQPGRVSTAGRLRHIDGRWLLTNAHAEIGLIGAIDWPNNRSLCRISGEYDGDAIEVDVIEVVHDPTGEATEICRDRSRPLARAFELRNEAVRTTRSFFTARNFTHVETPQRVDEPGTDVYLDPLRVEGGQGTTFLHTSPEFAMKELLSCGFERIWQLTHVWRGGERTPLHHEEFTILEWYRAWESTEALMHDIEALVGEVVGNRATVAVNPQTRTVELDAPFARMTMREVVDRACGFDLMEALDFESLLDAARSHELLSDRALERAGERRRWDELFFELQVSHIDPFLADQGAVFVTEWPSQLAVLARRKPEDPRVAERFELYVGGVELANGFHELTDPAEQRERFEEDIRTRDELGLPDSPMPERFLAALEYGLPPSSGVAVGFDRLLMLASGASHIREVLPYSGSSVVGR
jgi:lysyl-tRNA synthetase class 2